MMRTPAGCFTHREDVKMSETTNEANEVITQLLERALSGVDAAVEFSREQIPDVVQQLLLWHTVESLLWFCSGIIMIVFSVWLFKSSEPDSVDALHQRKDEARAAYDRGESWTRITSDSRVTSLEYDRIMRINAGERTEGQVAALVASLCSLGLSVLTLISNLTWLKIWIAPKLYLLEYGAALVR